MFFYVLEMGGVRNTRDKISRKTRSEQKMDGHA
jgi:hypothetical protein